MPTANTSASGIPSPVAQADRIVILDALRGFAILGILLMNIPGFGLPGGHDPSILHEYGTLNFQIWHFVEWFPEGTQRALFSMLFGAGIILFTTRQESKLPGTAPLDYFIRRQLWLMVFGLFDIFILLWWGDILFDYACYGLIMVAFRNLKPKALLIGAAICFVLMMVRENRDLYLDKKIISRGEMVAAIDTTTTKLTPQQKEYQSAMTEFKEESSRETRTRRLERAVRRTTGDYETLYEHRTGQYMNVLVKYLYLSLWDVLLFMFLGMAFYKLGILTGEASRRIYWLMLVVGLGVGLVVSYYRLLPLIRYDFNYYDYTRNVKLEYYTLSRTLRALGIFGLIMLLYKSGWCKWLFNLFRPVGQMAFTNYLTQSLICGLFFYGVGFGMFGRLTRDEVYMFVGAVWLVQITWSHIWLKYFYFGPFEWAWRSLTYWKRQPFKK